MGKHRDQGARGIRVERKDQDGLYGAHKGELRRKGIVTDAGNKRAQEKRYGKVTEND